ncbi:MAG: hypothetical protein K4571_18865 [Deltaproteobacteria bacterium]
MTRLIPDTARGALAGDLITPGRSCVPPGRPAARTLRQDWSIWRWFQSLFWRREDWKNISACRVSRRRKDLARFCRR